jgi:hypothetical protein
LFLRNIYNERRKGEKTKYRERGIPKKVPWEFVNYSFQIEDYFAIMKELNNVRMNP